MRSSRNSSFKSSISKSDSFGNVRQEKKLVEQFAQFINSSPRKLIAYRIEKMREKNKLIELENYVLESYLQRIDPNNDLEVYADEIDLRKSREFQKSFYSLNPSAAGRSSPNRKKPLIASIKHLIEITTREIKNEDENGNFFRRKCEKQKLLYNTKLQAISFCNADLKKSSELLTQNVLLVRHPITKRITERTFMTFLLNWIHAYDHEINKLRSEKLYLQRKFKTISNEFKTDTGLARNLLPIDFDVQKNKNKQLKFEFEEKTNVLKDLKRKCGDINLAIYNEEMVNINRIKNLELLKEKIAERKMKIENFENEIEKIKETLVKDLNEYEELKKSVARFGPTQPSVYEYIQAINTLRNIKSDIKVYQRKYEIQNLTLFFKRKRCNKYKLNTEEQNSYHYVQLRQSKKFRHFD